MLQRDKRLIAVKRKGQVIFVKYPNEVIDLQKRARLTAIQHALRYAYESGHLMSKIFVNHLGHVGYLHQGRVGLPPKERMDLHWTSKPSLISGNASAMFCQ